MTTGQQLQELATLALKTLDTQQNYFRADEPSVKRKYLIESKLCERDLRRLANYCLNFERVMTKAAL
jgi:hypothetical protein